MSDHEFPEAVGEVKTVSPAWLYERLATGEEVSILDVRDRDAFDEWHIDGPTVTAAQVPYVRFMEAEARDAVADRFAETELDTPVTVVCALGRSSGYVGSLLNEAGIDAANLEGGMERWATFDVIAPVPVDSDDVHVRQVLRPATGCTSYVLASGGVAVVIDPLRAFAGTYDRVLRDLDATLVGALDTHVHADHISGAPDIAAAHEAALRVPEGAIDRGYEIDNPELVSDGDLISIGDAGIEAIAAPGHTTELTVYRFDDLLFTGDCLFLDGVGRPDLESGTTGARRLARTLHATLRDRLGELPDDIRVLPGHMEPKSYPHPSSAAVASLGDLRANTTLFGRDEEAFVEAVLEDMPPRPANYEEIIRINLGRGVVDADAAAELELGPNNCAVSVAD